MSKQRKNQSASLRVVFGIPQGPEGGLSPPDIAIAAMRFLCAALARKGFSQPIAEGVGAVGAGTAHKNATRSQHGRTWWQVTRGNGCEPSPERSWLRSTQYKPGTAPESLDARIIAGG